MPIMALDKPRHPVRRTVPRCRCGGEGLEASTSRPSL